MRPRVHVHVLAVEEAEDGSTRGGTSLRRGRRRGSIDHRHAAAQVRTAARPWGHGQADPQRPCQRERRPRHLLLQHADPGLRAGDLERARKVFDGPFFGQL